MSLDSFYLRNEQLQSDACVVLEITKRLFGNEGYLNTFKRENEQKYMQLQPEIDSFVTDCEKKIEKCRDTLNVLNSVKNPKSNDFELLIKVEQDIKWLELAINGDDNYSGDFRSLGLLNFFGGCEREKLPLLRKLCIWTKHAVIGQELK